MRMMALGVVILSTHLIPLGLFLPARADGGRAAYFAISSMALSVSVKHRSGDVGARRSWGIVEGRNSPTIGPAIGRTSHGVA